MLDPLNVGLRPRLINGKVWQRFASAVIFIWQKSIKERYEKTDRIKSHSRTTSERQDSELLLKERNKMQ